MQPYSLVLLWQIGRLYFCLRVVQTWKDLGVRDSGQWDILYHAQTSFSWACFISKEKVLFLERSFLDTRVVRSEDWASIGTWKMAASWLLRFVLLLDSANHCNGWRSISQVNSTSNAKELQLQSHTGLSTKTITSNESITCLVSFSFSRSQTVLGSQGIVIVKVSVSQT